MSPVIVTSFVSSVAVSRFRDAVAASARLVPADIEAGKWHLRLCSRGHVSGDRLEMTGLLGTGRRRPYPVSLVLTSWSEHRTEFGIRSSGRTGAERSRRRRLFYEGAEAVLPAVIEMILRARADPTVLDLASTATAQFLPAGVG